MTTGEQGRTPPDAEHYLDLSGIEEDSPGPHFDVVLPRQRPAHGLADERLVVADLGDGAGHHVEPLVGHDESALEAVQPVRPSGRPPPESYNINLSSWTTSLLWSAH